VAACGRRQAGPHAQTAGDGRTRTRAQDSSGLRYLASTRGGVATITFVCVVGGVYLIGLFFTIRVRRARAACAA